MRVWLSFPQAFRDQCFLKAKVAKLLSRATQPTLLTSSHHIDLVESCAKALGFEWEQVHDGVEPLDAGATHVVLFDEAPDTELLSYCKEKGLPSRFIAIRLTRIVNVDREAPYDVYIGRGSPWGNPYALGPDGDRTEVIRKFAYDFHRGLLTDRETGLTLKELALQQLAGKTLGCHCTPAACHGDIIADYLNSHLLGPGQQR